MRKEINREPELLDENRRLKERIERLESVEVKYRRASEILRSIVVSTSAKTGTEFIRSLVENFALTLKVSYALVGEVIDGTQRVKTLAVWANGSFAENFEYDLEGTPCNNVVAQTMRYYPRDIKKLFPEDYIIADMEVESYLGVPIFDSRDNPLGVMGALDDKPFEDEENAKSLLSIFSARVGAEMERNRAEEALKESENKYRRIIETTMEGIWVIDDKGTTTFVNDRVAMMLGEPADKIIGTSLFEYMDEEGRKIASSNIENKRKKGIAGQYDFRIRRRDGSYFWALVSTTPVFDTTGRYAGVLGMISDITKRKEAEEALKISEERFRSLVETTSDWVWEVDENAVYTYASPKVRDILGYEPREIIGKTPFDLMPPEEAKRVAGIFGPIAASRRPVELLENINIHKDGRRITLETSGAPLFDSEGRFNGYRGIDRDITERKRAIDALIESEANLANAQRIARIGSGEWCFETDEIRWSDEMYRIFGVEKGTPVTFETFISKVHPEDVDEVKRVRADSLSEKKGYSHDYRLLLPDGTERFVRGNVEMFKDPSNGAIKFTGTVQDVTEIKRAETELRKYRERLEDLVEERTAELTEVNEQLRLEINERKKAEKKVTRLNEDLSHHVIRLEEANRELEAFSYSLAHDLSAPVRIINGFSNMLLKYYGDKLEGEGKHFIETITSNSLKMGRFITDILNLARLARKEIRFTEVDMNRLAESIFAELKHCEPERDIELVLNPLPPAYGEMTMLSQVFSNLLSNAVKFTRPRDKAVIEVGGRTEGGENIYCVKDNGVGFDMKHRSRLFEVFERLHLEDEFEGTGAGLAIIQRIIHRHGGRVWAEGTVNQGAAFYFALPLRAAKKNQKTVKNKAEKPASQNMNP